MSRDLGSESRSLQLVGRVAEWLKATDCKSVEGFLRRFESCLSQKFAKANVEREAKQPKNERGAEREARTSNI